MLHATAARARLRRGLVQDPAPDPPPGDRLAAVLALLVETPTPSLLFTERARTLSRHPGEISFPGGLLDPGERPMEAALRETHEEIGVDPDLPEILGALEPVHTYVSEILVVPFVGIVRDRPTLTPNRGEIAEVLFFGLSDLASVEAPMQLPREDGGQWHGWAYHLAGRRIWGATGWMLHALLELVRRETPWTEQKS